MSDEPNWNARLDDAWKPQESDRLDKMGVPRRVARALAPGVFRETPAIDVARAWLATGAGVLVLSGTVGSGKSVAAAWTLENNVETVKCRDPRDDAWEVIPRRRSGRWIAAADLVEASDFDAGFWDPLRKAELLVIDEAGPERIDTKGRALANFSGLLRTRYDNARRTVITTNLPPAEWLRLYGDADGGRLRDRLREAGADFGRSPVVAISDVSRRGRVPDSAAAAGEK
jgi:hypothetical protein